VAVTVNVIGDLRRFAENDTVEFETGASGECSLGSAVDELVQRNPRLGGELFDGQGREDGAEVALTRFFSGG
jgi:hypothetical protein